MPVHATARTGFAKASAEYDRGRPEYPPGAVAELRTALKLGPASRLVELGAGTGKFTRALRRGGLSPIGVEPVPAMRRRLRESLPEVAVLAGLAERLPFRNGSLDAVCAAQAFHWFDLGRTLPELARVLRSGGGVGIVWNVRDESVDWQRRVSEVIERCRPPGLPTHRTTGWKATLKQDARFTRVESHSERFVQRCDAAQLRDRIGSISFVANLDPSERESLIARVLEVAEPSSRSDGGPSFEIPYRTDIFWFRRR